MTQPKLQNPQSAFTLVEIVIVLTIIAVLAGGSIYMLKGLIGDAQGQRVDSDIQTIKVALGAYERNNYFKPPTEEQGLAALVAQPTSDPQPEKWRQYLEEVPKDPWGNEYQFRYPAQRSQTDKYDLFSLNEDGVENEDDIGNW
tara:strand:- start:674 stop:1102 length:429 start_codon:yes stop_codon:yes gene_type:complete